MIRYGQQIISQDDVDAVANVLKSDYLTQGPVIGAFEEAFAKYCGSNHAVAVSSATAGLHIACLSLGVGPGDVVWTSPNTFVATSNSALLCGASVDFVDIDPETYNMCANALAQKLRQSQKIPKVVIAVHFSGRCCDMKRLRELSTEYGFALIEDASHCAGGDDAGQKVGSCRLSDACVFSFHPVKNMTTGEGGMVTTNDRVRYDEMTARRTHGITRNPDRFTMESDGPWYYEQHTLAPNYRMTDFQAALGLSQLTRLDGFVTRRRALAARYDTLLADCNIVRPAPSTESAWHLYAIRVPEQERRRIVEQLLGDGIGVNVHYIPVHTQPFYKSLGFKHGDFPNAERYYREAITLPLHPGMTDEDQNFVVSCLRRILAN